MATAGPGSAVGLPGLQSSWPLTIRAACGRGSEAFRCGPGARAAPASQGVKEAAAGPEEGGCPLPHPRGVPCSAATPFPAPPPRSPGTRGHPPSTRFSSPRAHDVLPATREIRGGDSCHARPPERRRGTQGDGARPRRPERSPPRCRSAHSGTLVVITVIFSCSRFFSSRQL